MQRFEFACGVSALAVTLALVSCGGGTDDGSPPSGAPVGTGGESGGDGAGGKGSGGKGAAGGKGGRGGTGGSTDGGQSGDDAGATGTGHAGSTSGGEGNGKGGGGGQPDGAGNRGANGGGGNEMASGGAFIDGPDLECPEVTPPAEITPPLCDPSAKWNAGEDALPEPSGMDAMAAVSPDELTIAWRVVDALAPTVVVADRASAGEDFGPSSVLADSHADPADQVAIAPNRLEIVAAINGEFVEFRRTTTADPFTYAGRGRFDAIDSDAGQRALKLADPVLGADGMVFYYTVQESAAEGATIYRAQRDGEVDWPVGEPLDDCELAGVGGSSRRPTAISADDRTLFYYDEPRAQMRAAWRVAPDEPFDTFIDIDPYLDVRPNGLCDRLYYSVMTDTGQAVLVATQK